MEYVGNWNESQIMDMIWAYSSSNFARIGGKSFCCRTIGALKRRDLFVDNSGHGCEPPDYFSDKANIMFDVMRVNDSEKTKHNNPVFRAMASDVRLVSEYIHDSDCAYVLSDLETDDPRCYDDFHKFSYYKRHVNRVIGEHLSKLNIWENNHSQISRLGFVVCDECEVYLHVNERGFVDDYYRPWLDVDVMRPLIDSDLEFAVWFYPYMTKSAMDDISHGIYPSVIMVDLRNIVRWHLRKYVDDGAWYSGVGIEAMSR